MDEFRRKSSDAGQGEPFGPERDAWLRAVWLMVGDENVSSSAVVLIDRVPIST